MSGRGRGVSNKPAWMTRGDDGPGPGGPPTTNMGGGGGHPIRPGGGPPMRRGSYDNNRGGRYDEMGRGPRDDFRDRRRDSFNPPSPHDNHHHRGGGGGGGGRDSVHHHRGGGGGGDRRGGNNMSHNKNHQKNGAILFRSFEEEQQWVEDRRRKRLARKSKFDIMPTPEQLAADAAMAALSNPAATDFSGISASDRNFTAVPQQTRHARRLYIGQLPPNVTEQELHVFFRDAIEQAVMPNSPGTNRTTGRMDDDPILSVYINHERRFCFLEFKTVEMTTACMALDGIDVNRKGKVKVKRPNDYNPTMAPKVAPQNIPILDTSKLGIISGTVQDGANKIFVGGLHYHLTDEQVLELLHAFGKVKAFHLVKNEPDSMTSKGYCFVEYADPAVTQVAAMGLNGMDLGGGKMLTARVAGQRGGAAVVPAALSNAAAAASAANQGGILPNANIVHGYDIEALVDASLGKGPMPTAPIYLDTFGMPLTRMVATPVAASSAAPTIAAPVSAAALPSALDIANAALAAAYGAPTPTASAPPALLTRVLVLSNMVMMEDLASDDDYNGLQEEVREECAKFGQLRGMQIPRNAGGSVQQSAILKIFLEYASIQDAQAAERELKGRKFGDNVVQTSYFPEADYGAGKLS